MIPNSAPLAETSVLALRDPTLTNADDWPEFRLNDTTVTSPSNARPISLLLASEKHSVRVTGQVEAVLKKRAHLWVLSSKPRPTRIEVSDVQGFAYDDADGSVDLWAAGKSGWFKIKPSREYQPIYDEMVEAVKIMYFVVDAYKNPRKSGKGKNATVLPDYNAQELFEKYAIEVIGVEKAAPEAAKKMYKHREFLLSSMILEKEGMKWGKNPLYIHLRKKFLADWQKVKQRLDGPTMDVKKDTKAAAPHTRQASLDSASTTSSLKRKRGRPPKSANGEVVSIGSSSAASPPLEPPRKSTKLSPGAEVKLKAVPTRSTGSRSTRSNPMPSETEMEESQATTPAMQESEDDKKRRRKSALRLKPNKPMKGPPKRGSTAEGIEEDEEEEDELSQERSPPARRKGSKRKRGIEPESQADLPKRSSKRTNGEGKKQDLADTVDEGIDIPTTPSSDDEDAVAGADATDLPLRSLYQADQLQENAWTCALDGCTHKVYGPASAPEIQKLIREHYALHAYDDDERVQMVKRMAEPSLSTSYLVDKVRGFVGLELKKMDGSKVAGSRFPEGVKTKY